MLGGERTLLRYKRGLPMGARFGSNRFDPAKIRIARVTLRWCGRGLRRFACPHSRRAARAGLLPHAVIGDDDADSPGRKLRDHRAIFASEDAPPGAHAEPVQVAPLAEAKNAVIVRVGAVVFALAAMALCFSECHAFSRQIEYLMGRYNHERSHLVEFHIGIQFVHELNP